VRVDTAFSFALVSLPARQILPALSWARFVRSPVMAKSGHFLLFIILVS